MKSYRSTSKGNQYLPLTVFVVALLLLVGSAVAQDSASKQDEGQHTESDGLGPLTLSATHSLDATTDIRRLSGTDILWLLAHPQFVHVEGPSKNERKIQNWWAGGNAKRQDEALAVCNGQKPPSAMPTCSSGRCSTYSNFCKMVSWEFGYENPDINPRRYEALIRGCTWDAKGPGETNCGQLGSSLIKAGMVESGKAVLRFAPGCHTRSFEGLPENGCWGTAAIGDNRHLFSQEELMAILRTACESDLEGSACEVARLLGFEMHADMQALNRMTEARNADLQQQVKGLAEIEARWETESSERESAFEARMNTLRGIADQNRSAVLDAGNRQAAAIRAVGDASAAQQQVAVQRAAAQKAAQDAANRSSNTQSSSSQANGAVLPTGHTSAPLTVRFGNISGSQGNAHVVSTPPGIDCPSTCSFQFGQNVAVMLFATADQDSAVKRLSCEMSSGTGMLQAGNSMSCSIPQWADQGPQVTVYVDPYLGPGTTSASNGQGASGSGSGGNGNSSAGGGSGSAGGNSGTYLAPITQSCIREFWDPKYYNWLSFENDCGQAINLTWIARNLNDHFGLSNGDIAAGHSANTGWTQAEVATKGDFALFACPAGSMAVDANTNQAISSPNATYHCKKQ
jgi:hypothetical protein